MAIKLFDSELKIMEALWKEGDLTAGQLAKQMAQQTGWNRNTTYTVIKKCIEKGAIARREPNFMCHALLTKEEVQQQELGELIDKMFDGSAEMLFASLVSHNKLPADVAKRLKDVVDAAGGDTP